MVYLRLIPLTFQKISLIMSTKRDYYEILGISKQATTDEIKNSYRKLALKYHPDRNPNNKEAEEKFKEAAEAYQILSDPEKRKRYDQFGKAGFENMGSGPHDMNMDDIFENFGDIFESLFGGGRARSRSQKQAAPMPKAGHDLAKEVTITFKESFLGCKKEISFYHFVPCETCHSKGTHEGTSYQVCAVCHGSGQQQYRQGLFAFAQTCSSCGGEGFTIPSPCPTCKGQTRVQKLDKFSVTIPAGIYNEAELRIVDKGDAGVFGGPTGNLYVRVYVTPDKKFKRVDNDLECSIMLTYPQLVFGCQIDIELIDGSKESIRIPKGCAVGHRITVTGKGFANLRSKGHGNLVITTQCHIPTKLSNKAKDLLSQYSEEIGTDSSAPDHSITGFFKKFLG